MIWSGTGCEPDLSVFAPAPAATEDAAPEITADLADTAVQTPAAPKTLDPTAAAAALSLLTAAACAVFRKKR